MEQLVQIFKSIMSDPQQAAFMEAAVGAVLFLSISIIWLFYLKSFLNNAIKTQATVTSAKRHSGSNSTYYSLQVDFKTELNRPASCKVMYCTEKKPGDTIYIHYNPNNPTKAKSDDKWAVFALPVMILLIGLFFVGNLAYKLHLGIATIPF